MEEKTINYTVNALSPVRKMIGMNMSQSAFTAPHVTLTTQVLFDRVTALRAQINEKPNNTRRISINDVILYHTVKCLSVRPDINATFQNGTLRKYSSVNICLAVALESGLVVPVIPEAQNKSLTEISECAAELTDKARKGQLTVSNYQNGTFTVSNLGQQGIDAFTPIINLPQVAILGVGQVRDSMVVLEGTPQIRKACVFSLSFDHRVIDGKQAGEFLVELKTQIETASLSAEDYN